jgi:hypothetical protein
MKLPEGDSLRKELIRRDSNLPRLLEFRLSSMVKKMKPILPECRTKKIKRKLLILNERSSEGLDLALESVKNKFNPRGSRKKETCLTSPIQGESSTERIKFKFTVSGGEKV